MIRRFEPVILILAAAVSLAFLGGCEKKDNAATEKEPEKETVTTEIKKMDTEPKAAEPTKVKLQTNMGDIVIQLDAEKAPVTVKNFLTYVGEGFYDGTVFHRVIKGFMIQGGGFTEELYEKDNHASIVNEAKNGLGNKRGTIAMARTPNPDSATSQFYINHGDNNNLNYNPASAGYAVFGKVVEGMDVVDRIAVVKTTTKTAMVKTGAGTARRKSLMPDVPAESVVIQSATVVSGD